MENIKISDFSSNKNNSQILIQGDVTTQGREEYFRDYGEIISFDRNKSTWKSKVNYDSLGKNDESEI